MRMFLTSRIALLFFITLPFRPAYSAEFIVLNPESLRGRTAIVGNGTREYRSDGSYVQKRADGAVSRGKWYGGSNGQVCVEITEGSIKGGSGGCSTFLDQDGKLYLRNSWGNELRVRFAK